MRVLYVSRPAAIVQCGGAAAGALIEDDHGLGFYPADLVLDAGTYGEYTAALTQDGLRFPAHAMLSVCAAYKGAILPAAACNFQLLPGAMEDGHVLVRQDIPLPQPMTLGQMRRLHLRETARLCHAVAQSTLLGEQAALYPAFPSQPRNHRLCQNALSPARADVRRGLAYGGRRVPGAQRRAFHLDARA